MDLKGPEFLMYSRKESMGKQDTAKIYILDQDNTKVNDIKYFTKEKSILTSTRFT